MTTLLEKYCAKDPVANKLLGGSPFDAAIRKTAVEAAKQRPLPDGLGAVLDASNIILGKNEKRDANLKLLKDGKAVCVVTGQQVGLFGGPLYTLYKALSVIKLAQTLTAETGTMVVPVFWLQTEDHDFPEISRTNILDSQAQIVPLEIIPPKSNLQDGDRVSVENRSLGANVRGLMKQLEETLSGFDFAADFLPIFKKHYYPEKNFGTAFAGALADLLPDSGLVFFNPRARGIEKLTAPIYKTALEREAEITKSLTAQTAELKRLGFEAPVMIRENSPLFFVHQGHESGPRYRVELDGADYKLIGTEARLSKAELETIIEKQPRRLSSSALLRPIIQDALLPAVCYVGGPGELDYWAQLSPLYEIFGVRRSLFVPRASFRIIEERAKRLRAQTAESGTNGTSPVKEKTVGAIDRALDEMKVELVKADKTLGDSLEKTREKIHHQVDVLGERYEKAVSRGDAVQQERTSKLNNMLRPEGEEQERFFGAPYFLTRYGKPFIEKIEKAINVFDPRMQELEI